MKEVVKRLKMESGREDIYNKEEDISSDKYEIEYDGWRDLQTEKVIEFFKEKKGIEFDKDNIDNMGQDVLQLVSYVTDAKEGIENLFSYLGRIGLKNIINGGIDSYRDFVKTLSGTRKIAKCANYLGMNEEILSFILREGDLSDFADYIELSEQLDSKVLEKTFRILREKNNNKEIDIGMFGFFEFEKDKNFYEMEPEFDPSMDDWKEKGHLPYIIKSVSELELNDEDTNMILDAIISNYGLDKSLFDCMKQYSKYLNDFAPRMCKLIDCWDEDEQKRMIIEIYMDVINSQNVEDKLGEEEMDILKNTIKRYIVDQYPWDFSDEVCEKIIGMSAYAVNSQVLRDTLDEVEIDVLEKRVEGYLSEHDWDFVEEIEELSNEKGELSDKNERAHQLLLKYNNLVNWKNNENIK